jgi:hypothetical protein
MKNFNVQSDHIQVDQSFIENGFRSSNVQNNVDHLIIGFIFLFVTFVKKN